MANNSQLVSNIVNAGKLLAVFAIVASAMVTFTNFITKDRIAENERLALLHNLNVLIPKSAYNNELTSDILTVEVKSLSFRGNPVTVYRARFDQKPVAAIFNVTAPDGYNGAINLLIGINTDGTLAGVRVVSHKETPGLGDAIDIEKSPWIKIFDARSLSNPSPDKWRVKKDGGVFDQLTGATITPRAIVKITRKTLEFFSGNKDRIFE